MDLAEWEPEAEQVEAAALVWAVWERQGMAVEVDLGTGNVKLGHRGKARVKIRKGRTRIVGGLSQEVVGRYIKRYWAQFKYCYERELTKNPNLYGKVTTNFTIAGKWSCQ